MTELLPSDVDKNIKLESIGDIKILELTPDQLKHKEFLGKVVLEKSPLTHTVLLRTRDNRKEDSVGKHFYYSKYELLCGEPKTEIEIVEGTCKFKIDLLKTYYESTLQMERERMVSELGKDNFVCDLLGDLFFSIRAAKANNLHILANCNNNNVLYEAFDSNMKSNAVFI